MKSLGRNRSWRGDQTILSQFVTSKVIAIKKFQNSSNNCSNKTFDRVSVNNPVNGVTHLTIECEKMLLVGLMPKKISLERQNI